MPSPAHVQESTGQDTSIAARSLLWLIGVYRIGFSWFFAGSCRFLPTCSEYAADAVRTHGAMAGTRLAAARLLRCHPFCAAGFDPVPPARGGLAAAPERHSR